MIDVLKSIILDYQEIELETGIPRRLHIEPLPQKASVLTGVRRCGKSTYLFQLIKKLLKNGIPRQNILYINFFDDRLYNLKHEHLGMLAEAYFSLYPEKKGSEKIFCFFDEIQTIPGWEPFVERMLRTEKCEIYLSGSSAKMLSKEIATQMRGRALAWEVFPFSFHEFLDYKSIEFNLRLSTKKRLLIQKVFEEYWNTGGFPETIGCSRALRIRMHQEYFHTILYRDLVERYDIAYPRALTDLAHWLVNNIASLYSINRLTGYLKALGHKVPKSSVANYLEWFEDAYFLFTVRIFDPSYNRSNTNPKKIYCIDHALVTSVSSGILVNTGHLLENLVFIGLRRIHPEIYYYKTKTGREIDFIIHRGSTKKQLELIQVCESLANPQTRKREIEALYEAMRELNVNIATIVTRHEEQRIVIKGATIEVIPAWRFLLELPDTDS